MIVGALLAAGGFWWGSARKPTAPAPQSPPSPGGTVVDPGGPAAPDLAVGIGWPTPFEQRDPQLVVSATLVNLGNVDTGPFEIQLFDGDTRLEVFPQPGGLAAGRLAARELPVPGRLAAGPRRIRVRVEPLEGETVTDNNEAGVDFRIRSAREVSPQLPDLAVGIGWPADDWPLPAGGNLTISATVANVGRRPSSAFTLLFLDVTEDPPTPLGTLLEHGLDPGQLLIRNLTVPRRLSRGRYEIHVGVTTPDREISEDNNTARRPFDVRPAPREFADLTLGAVWADPARSSTEDAVVVAADRDVRLRATVVNAGSREAERFSVRFVETGERGEQLLGEAIGSRLGAGRSTQVETSPVSLPEGIHEIVVEVLVPEGEPAGGTTGNNTAPLTVEAVIDTVDGCRRSRDLWVEASKRVAALPLEPWRRPETLNGAVCLAVVSSILAPHCGGGSSMPRMDALLRDLYLLHPETGRRRPPSEPKTISELECPRGTLIDVPDCRASKPESRAPVRAVAVHPDGAWLAVGSEDGHVHLMNVAGERPVHLGDLGSPVRAVTMNRDGLVAGTYDGRIHISRCRPDGPPCEGLRSFQAHAGDPDRTSVNALAVKPDAGASPRIASGGSDGWIRLLDLSGTEMGRVAVAAVSESRATADDRPPRVFSLAFSPDGSAVAAATNAGVLVCDSELRKCRWLDDGPSDARSVAFAKIGRELLLAGGGRDGRIALWRRPSAAAVALRQWAEGPEPEWLEGHVSRVNALGFLGRAPRIASGSSDGSVRIWSIDQTDRPSEVLTGHDSWIWSIAFRPGQQRPQVVSGSEDRTVRIWSGSRCYREEFGEKIRDGAIDCREWLDPADLALVGRSR